MSLTGGVKSPSYPMDRRLATSWLMAAAPKAEGPGTQDLADWESNAKGKVVLRLGGFLPGVLSLRRQILFSCPRYKTAYPV